jgi:hypothetical protein
MATPRLAEAPTWLTAAMAIAQSSRRYMAVKDAECGRVPGLRFRGRAVRE